MNLALTPYARHRAAQLPQNPLLWAFLAASPFSLKPASGQIDSLNTASGQSTLWQAASRLGLQACAQQSASAEPIAVNSAGKGAGAAMTEGELAASKVKWVDENAGMSQTASNYNDSATGARSNPATRSGQAR